MGPRCNNIDFNHDGNDDDNANDDTDSHGESYNFVYTVYQLAYICNVKFLCRQFGVAPISATTDFVWEI